ncbi:MAG TPA: iron ABC transporter permease [Thermoanaerobaculia bacterium]|nr:iron ABC transporter permease [Thermoanaerobaculia bacterium]
MSARRDLAAGVVLLAILLALSIVAALGIGAVPLSWIGALREDGAARTILFEIRLPRVLLAAAVGAVLAASGITFQTLLRNPLADPFILGVSGGAACGAALATALGAARMPGVVPVAAFAGALMATVAVVAIAARHGSIDPTRLILGGLVLNAFFSALILLSLSVIRGSDLTAALHWMMGSLANASWTDVALVGGALAIALAVLGWIAGDVRMLAFGEDDARSRGVDTGRIRLIAFVTASLATGAAVAASGIIGFVGLIVPHAIRLIWKRDFRLLLPLSALGGAVLVVLADAVARGAAAPAELPLAALTAMLGVPFFLVLLRRVA